ncbi:MAG: hypothetical protein LC708_04460, partial [Actinobacteria bacterium]|nr:hypothetical protein [Actinomycetota bacterium]
MVLVTLLMRTRRLGPLRHVLAAVHAAIAVAVGAAAVLHVVALHAAVPGGLLPRSGHLMMARLGSLVLVMALGLGGRRGLGGGGQSEDERHRGDENLHWVSP